MNATLSAWLSGDGIIGACWVHLFIQVTEFKIWEVVLV